MSIIRTSLPAWLPCLLIAVADAAPRPLQAVRATASSQSAKAPASKAIDGAMTDQSRWISKPDALPAWIDIEFAQPQALAGVHVYSGFGSQHAVEDFKILFWHQQNWKEIPSAVITGNRNTALAVPFDQTVDVTTDKLRVLVTRSHQNTARIREIVVWPSSGGEVPPIPAAGTQNGSSQADIPLIYLNQSGFNLGKPKRFTAPTLPDGTAFAVKPSSGGQAVASGTIRQHIGDFSSFDPISDEEFIVEAGGLRSVPFRIGPCWLERVSYQNAVNFMIDSRHYVGNDRATCGGSFGWRDDHHFGWELHTLVPQWLSNPSAYERMPRQVRYEAPKNPKLWGKLEPYRDDAPDLVKLIHWGADIIVTQQLKHELLKSQLAYFLYAWPVLSEWLPRQNYEVVRDYAFSHWAESGKDRNYPYDESKDHNLLALKTHIGSTKGCFPPGFSVQPNLLMYEVALRERRPDAQAYLKAACQQAEWMVKQLDWKDPLVTKGQRMSEFLTVTGLAHLLSEYPDKAPAGLAEKINQWAEVVIRRSDNLWDFRKLGDAPDSWTPMGDKPTKWNEPGNVVGLPAPILAALPFIRSEKHQQRLNELTWSHFDQMFGRNPVGRHFSFDAPREVEGVEHGWFKFYPGGIGRLANARFVIDGSPKNAHYPYAPEKGDIGWTEGWIQFNTAFNVSLAYLAWSESKVEATIRNQQLVVRLTAPLNFDSSKVETGSVVVRSGNGDVERVVVTETSPSAMTFTGSIRLQSGASAKSGDQAVQFSPGTTIQVSHGFGYLGRHAKVVTGPTGNARRE